MKATRGSGVTSGDSSMRTSMSTPSAADERKPYASEHRSALAAMRMVSSIAPTEISAALPGALEPILVGIEVDAPGRSEHAPAAEQDLQRLGAGDAGTQVAGHHRRGSAALRQVDARRIDEIAQLQHGRREADQETRRLLRFGAVAHAEVLLESHLPRHEGEQRRAHPERGHRDGGDAARRAQVEDHSAHVEDEEIE